MRECQVSPDELFALYEDARRRVERSPRMRQYQDTILGDWSPWPDHLRWVIKAKVSEIVEWAETIRRDCE
jgi:hypothetical protein